MRAIPLLPFLAALAAAAPALAQPLPLLPPDEEVALARSAAPEAIGAEATVYRLTAEGYQLAVRGRNGFSCMVERDHPEALEPICYDAEGSATIVPRVLAAAALRARGASPDSIRRFVAEGYRSGQFRHPSRTGVAYMLSPRTRFVNPQTGGVEAGTPHLMFYAPYLRNADIGSPGESAAAGSQPFVIEEGTPQAYIIVLLPADTSPSGADGSPVASAGFPHPELPMSLPAWILLPLALAPARPPAGPPTIPCEPRAPSPVTQDPAEAEVRTVIEELVRETAEHWRTGIVPPGAHALRVTDDLTATQYAPWYPGGRWVGDRASWIEGTVRAAEAPEARRYVWTLGWVEILRRSADEVVAVYQLCARFADAPERGADAVFMETWIRRDGAWRLMRHTAEKARRPAPATGTR